MLRRLAKLFVAALAFLAPVPVSSHGYLANPTSRNLIAHRAGLEYDHHSLNGGGPWTVWPTGQWRPGGGGNHPLCGRDAYSGRGAAQATWLPGQDVRLSVVVTAPHAGHWYFGLCPAGMESPACFASGRLRNTADGTDYFNLKNQRGSLYGAAGAYDMTFRVPAPLAPGDYVLQWYWLTGNSCDPPGDAPTAMGLCGGGGAVPEEFWNCADVRIAGPPLQQAPPVRAPRRSPPPKSPSPKPRKSPKPPRKLVLESPSPPPSRSPSRSPRPAPRPSPRPACCAAGYTCQKKPKKQY